MYYFRFFLKVWSYYFLLIALFQVYFIIGLLTGTGSEGISWTIFIIEWPGLMMLDFVPGIGVAHKIDESILVPIKEFLIIGLTSLGIFLSITIERLYSKKKTNT